MRLRASTSTTGAAPGGAAAGPTTTSCALAVPADIATIMQARLIHRFMFTTSGHPVVQETCLTDRGCFSRRADPPGTKRGTSHARPARRALAVLAAHAAP